MEYTSVDEARGMDGLRLTLTAGLPAPWSESAKAVFNFKNIPFIAVAQLAGEENPELVEWTRHRNAPTAMYNDEAPRSTWLDIVNLAEHLAPEPSLFPADQEDRILMMGLLDEIAGEDGFLWNARHVMFASVIQAHGEEAMKGNPMMRDYRYSPEAAARATRRVIAILDRLALQLERQAEKGSRYFLGDRTSALDLYWACFSQVLDQLPAEVNPMPDGVRQTWSVITAEMETAGYSPRPILLEHRQFVFEEIIGLPLTF